MKIEELKNTATDYHAKLVFPKTDLQNQIEQELIKLQQTVKMNGFRNGKVPISMLQKKYALSVKTDIITKTINKAITDIQKDNDLNLAGEPQIKDVVNDDDSDFSCKIEYSLLPEVVMPDLSKISLEKPEISITPAEVTDALKKIADNQKLYDQESTAKSKIGDQLTIDAVGSVDNKEFPGGKLEAHKIVLGSKTFIPGFEDQLVGYKKNDDVDVTVDFPADYHAKDLAGKPALFKVKILGIHKAKTVKIDQEFAKQNKCKDLDELKSQITDHLQNQYTGHIYDVMKLELFNKLEKTLDYHVPQTLLDRELQLIQQQTENDPEITKKTDAARKKYFEKIANRRIRIGFLIAEYVKQNNIQVTNQDIEQAILKEAQSFPMQANEILELYRKNQQAVEMVKASVMENKAVQHMLDNTLSLKTKKYSAEKFNEFMSTSYSNM